MHTLFPVSELKLKLMYQAQIAPTHCYLWLLYRPVQFERTEHRDGPDECQSWLPDQGWKCGPGRLAPVVGGAGDAAVLGAVLGGQLQVVGGQYALPVGAL